MKQWISLVFIGFCAISSTVHASPDSPAGSYLITSYGDDNILDGIQLHSQTMDLIISTIDGLGYTATYGIGGPQLSMVRDGYLLSEYPRPQDFGSGWATNAYILSDGVNGAWVHMGQEYDNPDDISIHLATWTEDREVTASQLVGEWIMQGVDDTNLRSNPSAPFNMITYTWLVTDLGGGLLDMYMVEEDAHWNMQLNGNVLEPVSITPIDAWHAYVSMMTNGQTIVFAVLSTELYDEMDVSPFIGFATRDSIDIDIDRFNIKSGGGNITCYITPRGGYYADDIVVDSIRLEGMFDVKRSQIRDRTLKVVFDKSSIKEYIVDLGLTLPSDVTLTIYGEFVDGTPFECSDTIHVIKPGR